MTIEDYNAVDAVRSSTLSAFANKDWAKLTESLHGQFPSNQAIRFGSLVHTFMEGDSIHDKYLVKPDGVSAVAKRALKSEAERTGKELVTTKVFNEALEAAQAIGDHVKLILASIGGTDIFKEASVFSTYKGLAIKSRPDLFCGGIVDDFKTSGSQDPYGVMTAFNYDLQLALQGASFKAAGFTVHDARVILYERLERKVSIVPIDHISDTLDNCIDRVQATLDDWLDCFGATATPSIEAIESMATKSVESMDWLHS